MKKKTYLPFMTGSRAYGNPSEGSDLDIVTLLSEEGGDIFGLDLKGDYPDQETIRLGLLNIIVVRCIGAYLSWLTATQRMVKWKEAGFPVPRDIAIKEITKEYALRGLGHLREKRISFEDTPEDGWCRSDSIFDFKVPKEVEDLVTKPYFHTGKDNDDIPY